MTDPIQTTNPPQGQQPVTDDILWWEDIFAGIPQATPEVPVKTAPEVVPEVTSQVAPQVAPVPEQKTISQPATVKPMPQFTPLPNVDENVIEEDITPEEIEEIDHEAGLEEAKVESLLDTKTQTDVQKKFEELFFTTKKIYTLKAESWATEETFDILWADNDKIFISYRFLLDDTENSTLFITKIEQNKETEEETINELKFTFDEEKTSLEVTINDILLFDEIEDFTEDSKKKMQVMDKLNKFIFLASEELRKLEKAIKEREEEEKERRKLQEIFRNF